MRLQWNRRWLGFALAGFTVAGATCRPETGADRLDGPTPPRSNIPALPQPRDPARVSYDGRRRLFVDRSSANGPRGVWEIGVDGSGPVELVHGPNDCLEALYLPKIYTLDAEKPVDQIGFLAVPPDEKVASLYTCRANGTHVRRITFAPGGVSDPTVLLDGRLLFRVKRVGLDALTSEWFTVRTDGTELAAARGEDLRIATRGIGSGVDHLEPPGASSVVRENVSVGQLYGLDSSISDEPSAAAVRRVRVLGAGRISDVDPQTEIESHVLGEATVEADGSFYVELPARTPFRLATLDEHGAVVRTMKSWMWVMPGERRGCIGCHEDRERTPPNRHVLALRKPPQRVGLPMPGSQAPDMVGED